MIGIKAQARGEVLRHKAFRALADIGHMVYWISPGQKKKPHAEHEAVRSTSL
jgi:hypothetical protein